MCTRIFCQWMLDVLTVKPGSDGPCYWMKLVLAIRVVIGGRGGGCSDAASLRIEFIEWWPNETQLTSYAPDVKPAKYCATWKTIGSSRAFPTSDKTTLETVFLSSVEKAREVAIGSKSPHHHSRAYPSWFDG